MSRQKTRSNGVKLPYQLQQELGLEVQKSGYGGRRRNGAAGIRKERRRADRIQKKAARSGRVQQERPRADHAQALDGEDDEMEDMPAVRPEPIPVSKPTKTVPPKLKSILKKPAPVTESSSGSDQSTSSRASSPGLVLDINSRAFKERAAQDEAEVTALEKKLGLKNKKLPKSFEDDGLDDLLIGLDSDDEPKKRKREGDEWLEKKRRKADVVEDDESDDQSVGLLDELEEEEAFSDLDGGELASWNEGGAVPIADNIDGGTLDSDASSGIVLNAADSTDSPAKKERENPYVAPVVSDAPARKYVPPSLRMRNNQDSESVDRLRRQMQGHLNKLSESNLISILGEIEKLYQSHARQDVTSTLVDMLIARHCDPASLQSTFVNLHTGFIAAVYKVIGIDFGAEIVSKLVERLDGYGIDAGSGPGKESNNLASLLSHLFLFHVINSTLVFDYIRLFLEELNETNTELVLKIVRDCGPQLRQDDPSSLKSIVQIMQNATAKLSADGKETSVRTKFMIETINDLKNNKMRGVTHSFGIASEHITQMRKVLGTLNSRNLRASEPLRISRMDVRNSDKKGKWWLVGASWKGNEALDVDAGTVDEPYNAPRVEAESEEADVLALARQFRMNTDIRRSIFVAIMSASDFQDAHVRMMKLRLKRSQEQEIPKVLLRCAGAEAAYNPYYTLIATKLCSDKKMKMSFQFVLWDFFKKMGEKGDAEVGEDEDELQNVELPEIVNLAKMYGHLVTIGALSICILKTLNLTYLKDQAKMFVEVFLIVILNQHDHAAEVDSGDRNTRAVFSRATESPQLIKPLHYFLKKHVRSSDLVSKKDKAQVKHGCRVAIETLDLISTSTSVGG